MENLSNIEQIGHLSEESAVKINSIEIIEAISKPQKTINEIIIKCSKWDNSITNVDNKDLQWALQAITNITSVWNLSNETIWSINTYILTLQEITTNTNRRHLFEKWIHHTLSMIERRA